MRQVPLFFPFSLALFFSICSTVFLPKTHFLTFSPFLAILYNKTNFIRSLWIASLCGLVIDLLSSELRLGVYALNYCLTTALLYQQKKHFFEDKTLSLSLFTAIISTISTLLHFFFLCIFDQAIPLSAKYIIADLIIMPLADGGYALFGFTLPMKSYAYIKKVGWREVYLKWLRFFSKRNEPHA
jgi:rod shape-determining protein MreD